MTVQIQDSLNLDGEPVSLASDMEISEHPRIRKLNEEAASASYSGAFSTACHRNFLASWAIKDGKLYLVDVIGIYNLIGEELLFADWYSGTLEAQAGKLIRRPGIGCDSRYEREFEIEVKDGVVIRQWEVLADLSVPSDVPPFLRKALVQ